MDINTDCLRFVCQDWPDSCCCLSHASQKAHTNRALTTKGYCIVMRQQHSLQTLNNRKGQEREIEMDWWGKKRNWRKKQGWRLLFPSSCGCVFLLACTHSWFTNMQLFKPDLVNKACITSEVMNLAIIIS